MTKIEQPKDKMMITIGWTSPSNIALIKYWGKWGNQLPQNPSLSFTLKHSVTSMSVSAHKRIVDLNNSVLLDFFFEGKKNSKFEERIVKFLKTQIKPFPWLLDYHLTIHSSNTFPHSSGIASSASSMSALSLSLLSLSEVITGTKLAREDFFKSASELSRLASGSAARSVYGGLVSWGESSAIAESSNQYAIGFEGSHKVFQDYCDSILIVDDGEKSVASSIGHQLMEQHPFRDQRFQKARENFNTLTQALLAGDLPTFIEIVEEEALMLHALMMTSKPSAILLKPSSLWLIDKIRTYRNEKKIPVCFTIDAGPNIHLLYPKIYESVVRTWIENDLSSGLVGKKWIHDEVGEGPKEE